MAYAKSWLSAQESFIKREAFGARERDRENQLRTDFAQGVDKDQYENLLNVFDESISEAWKYAKRFEEDSKVRSDSYGVGRAGDSRELICMLSPSLRQKVPVLFPLKWPPPASSPAVVSRDEFNTNWRTFTEGSLQYLDWSNIFAAGGAVQACLSPLPPHVQPSIAGRRDYLRTAFPAADIDLFIWGLTEDAAKKKMEEIYQLILRLYSSPSEILAGFDVDSCSVGFDGTDVWSTPRAHLATVLRRNYVDMSRRSPSYEVRLAKYAQRGFEVVAEGLKRSRIGPDYPQLFERPFEKVQGLARLLLLESFPTPADRMTYKEKVREHKLRPPHERAGEYRRRARGSDLTGNGVDSNDYSSVFMPYGEGWTASRIVRKAQQKDYVLNSPYTRKFLRSTTHHQHPCFWGSMTDILGDLCGQCPAFPSDRDAKEDDLFVHGSLSFITHNPGRQQIGSFNPITEGDWTAGAYIMEDVEGLFTAIAACDVAKVKLIVSQGVDVNARDYVGRSPIHLTILCDATEILEVLLEAGAKISVAIPDGRSTLHLCAEYGRLEAAKLILRRNQRNLELKTARESAAVKRMVPDEEQRLADVDESNTNTNSDYDIVSRSEESFVEIDEPFNPFQKAPTELVDAVDPSSDDIIDLDFEDWDMKMTALQCAIFYGELELVKILIGAGASKNRMMPIEYLLNGWQKKKGVLSPLVLAMACPNREAGKKVLSFLIEENVPVNQVDHNYATPVAIAIQQGLTEFVRLLLDEHPRTRLSLNFPIIVQNEVVTPMRLAVETADLEIIKLVHDRGGKTAMDESDGKRAISVMKKGTNPTIYWLRSVDPIGIVNMTRQPLEVAVSQANIQIITFLLESGANPNIPVRGSDRLLLDNLRQTIKDTESTLSKYRGNPDPNDFISDKQYFWQLAETGSWRKWYLGLSLDMEFSWNPNPPSAPWGIEPLQPDNDEIGNLIEQEAKDAKTELPKFLTPEEVQNWNIGIVSKRLDRLRACEQILQRFGAKTFEEVNPTVRSTPKSEAIPDTAVRRDPMRTAYEYYGGDANQTKKFGWTTAQPGEEAERYHSLFEACFRGQSERIMELTLHAKPGHDVLVASRVAVLGGNLTPFTVAIYFGHLDCLKALLLAANHQYVPEEEKKQAKELGKLAKLSNRTPVPEPEELSDEDDDSDGEFEGKQDARWDPQVLDQPESPKERLISPLRAADLLLMRSRLQTLMSTRLYTDTDGFGILAIRGSEEMMNAVVAHLKELDAHQIVGTLGKLGKNVIGGDGLQPKYNLCSEISNSPGNLGSLLQKDSPVYWSVFIDIHSSEAKNLILSFFSIRATCAGNVGVLRLLIRNGLGGLSPDVLLTRDQKRKLEESRTAKEVQEADESSSPDAMANRPYRKLLITRGEKKPITHIVDGERTDDLEAGDNDFFNYNSPPKASLVHIAVLHGRESILAYLLSNDLVDDISEFVTNYPDDPRSLQFREKPGDRDLFIDVVIRGYPHPRHGDHTVVHYAVFGNQPSMLITYVTWFSNRFKNDKVSDFLETKNREGITPLHLAASLNFSEMVKVLLDLGADCFNTDYNRGWNIAHFARFAVFVVLMSALKNDTLRQLVNSSSKMFLHTPLMIASAQGHHRVVNFLASFNGAQADLLSRTALDLAVQASSLDSVKALLAENGADSVLAKESLSGFTPIGTASHLLRKTLHDGQLTQLLPVTQKVKRDWPKRKGLEGNNSEVLSLERDIVSVYNVVAEASVTASPQPRTIVPLNDVMRAIESFVPEKAPYYWPNGSEAPEHTLDIREKYVARFRRTTSIKARVRGSYWVFGTASITRDSVMNI
ncbi:hypothetical protein HDU93_000207 [Gonapodya sp. JEL0774]|nr:hypothetical protein HDU93_000207 [Gonapodya sp. JEL0774]